MQGATFILAAGIHYPAVPQTLMKYLLLILVLYLLWRAWSAPRRKKDRPATGTPSETMLPCAHCGVHFPQGEAVQVDGKAYCCMAHSRLAAKETR